MDYQQRLAERKREFGRVFPPLTITDHSSETTVPAPIGWNYFRSYQPKAEGKIDNTPLPCEKPNYALTRRFEY